MITLDTLEAIDSAQREHEASITEATRAALKALTDHRIDVRVQVAVPEGPGFLGRGAAAQVNGNTYPVRETLKRYGFRWNAGRKCWQTRGAVDLNALAPALLSAFYAHEDASACERPRPHVMTRAGEAAIIDRLFPRAVGS